MDARRDGISETTRAKDGARDGIVFVSRRVVRPRAHDRDRTTRRVSLETDDAVVTAETFQEDRARLEEFEKRADPNDKEQQDLLEQMRQHTKRLEQMREHEDPRLSFTTPEFKEAQRVFQENYKARPRAASVHARAIAMSRERRRLTSEYMRFHPLIEKFRSTGGIRHGEKVSVEHSDASKARLSRGRRREPVAS